MKSVQYRMTYRVWDVGSGMATARYKAETYRRRQTSKTRTRTRTRMRTRLSWDPPDIDTALNSRPTTSRCTPVVHAVSTYSNVLWDKV